ncbi:MAG TPA: histidine triad nucleotide-binding protein [Ignavibacteriaceae bacterium]|nr:histidine triad nucleotide-binding protein [Ignavibacteriaceae bacterium]
MKKFIVLLIVLLASTGWSQTAEYQKKKAEKIEEGSVFTKIIKGELPAKIVYEDDDVIAFLPLRLQAPVHILIVPKKEIHTVNDVTDEDVLIMGKLFLVAKKLAKEKGISETGYRLVINCNEDAGQSVFHIHMHLLGGKKLGAMLNRGK